MRALCDVGRLAATDARPQRAHVCIVQTECAGHLLFRVSAHDGVDEICRGTHERYVIDSARFADRAARKLHK